MLMYHPKATEPVDVHPSQVENMKAQGWTEEAPKSPPGKAKDSQAKAS